MTPGKRPTGCGLLLGAAELACYQTLGFTFQLVGLNWTTASRSAFLLYLNATIVPVVATILGERGIGLRTWVCVAMAVIGTLMLVNDGGQPNIGDLWSFGAAFWSAMFIVRLTHAAKGHGAVRLSAGTLALTAVGCWALAAAAAARVGLDLSHEILRMEREHLAALAYLSVIVSGGSSFLQASGQQQVPPHEAAIIYTLDPVYGALFAWLLLGERLHALGWVGIVLVVAANLTRRLPWPRMLAWMGARATGLITPATSEVALSELDPKRRPLLGTPRTPEWWAALTKGRMGS